MTGSLTDYEQAGNPTGVDSLAAKSVSNSGCNWFVLTVWMKDVQVRPEQLLHTETN